MRAALALVMAGMMGCIGGPGAGTHPPPLAGFWFAGSTVDGRSLSLAADGLVTYSRDRTSGWTCDGPSQPDEKIGMVSGTWSVIASGSLQITFGPCSASGSSLCGGGCADVPANGVFRYSYAVASNGLTLSRAPDADLFQPGNTVEDSYFR